MFEKISAQPDPAYLPIALDFYTQLDNLSDAALTSANFSRAEIGEGLADLKKLYQKR